MRTPARQMPFNRSRSDQVETRGQRTKEKGKQQVQSFPSSPSSFSWTSFTYPACILLAGALGLFCNWGCAAHRGEHQPDQQIMEAACAGGMQQIQRRFFVSSQGRIGVNGEAGSLARELTAALNATANCSAIMLPLDFPIDPAPGSPPGSSPQLLRFIESAGPSPAIDELLVVYVTDIIPFRPMRISAVLERRSIAEGIVLHRDQRTWNAPLDMDPLSPSPLNRMLLNRPPPMGLVEKHELNRLSPLTFQRDVAAKVAQELAIAPL